MRADPGNEKIMTGAQPQCLERPSVATHVIRLEQRSTTTSRLGVHEHKEVSTLRSPKRSLAAAFRYTAGASQHGLLDGVTETDKAARECANRLTDRDESDE